MSAARSNITVWNKMAGLFERDESSNPLPSVCLKFDSVPLKSSLPSLFNGTTLGFTSHVRERIRLFESDESSR